MLTHAFAMWKVTRVCFHTDAGNQVAGCARASSRELRGDSPTRRMAADCIARDSCAIRSWRGVANREATAGSPHGSGTTGDSHLLATGLGILHEIIPFLLHKLMELRDCQFEYLLGIGTSPAAKQFRCGACNYPSLSPPFCLMLIRAAAYSNGYLTSTRVATDRFGPGGHPFSVHYFIFESSAIHRDCILRKQSCFRPRLGTRRFVVRRPPGPATALA
jgi:hypothetical protein